MLKHTLTLSVLALSSLALGQAGTTAAVRGQDVNVTSGGGRTGATSPRPPRPPASLP